VNIQSSKLAATSPLTVLEMFGADFALLNSQLPTVHAAIERAMAERLPGKTA
jgi:hypothetical protein